MNGAVTLIEAGQDTVLLQTTGATKLSDLSDVDRTSPATDGQVLKYSTSDSKWKPGDDNTGA